MATKPAKSEVPLGIRLNNPGNLKQTDERTPWQGRVPDYLLTQRTYEEFSTMVKGVRAMAVTLITYQDKHKIRTIRSQDPSDPKKGVVARFAPESDRNPTEKYISNVSRWSGIPENRVMDLHNFADHWPLIRAMIRQEHGNGPHKNGLWVEDAVIEEGLRQAGVVRPIVTPGRGVRSRTIQTAARSSTIQTASMAGIGGTVLGTSAVVDAANEAKSMLTPGTWLYIILTLIVVGCCVYMVYHRFKQAQLEGE